MTMTLGALCQVVRIYADTVATYQTRAERQEIPFGTCGLQDVKRVYSHLGKNVREFIDKGNIDIALRVLYHLCSFGHFDGRGKMGACRDNGGINLIDILSYFGSRSRSYLFDMLYRMLLVARIDTLGGVACKEVFIHLHATNLLHHRNTFVLSHSRIDR